MIIDTSDASLIQKSIAYQADFWDKACYFLFGGVNAYFDNYELVELTNLPSAVPSSLAKADYAATSIRIPKSADSNNGEYLSAGIRFRGAVSHDVKSTADEIGFVMTSSSHAVADADWYNMTNGLKGDAKSAVCYQKGVKDVIYEDGPDSTMYQLILVNLSTEDGKTAFIDRFSVVMYIKTGSSYTYYALGETSYYQVNAAYNVMNVDYDDVKSEFEEPLVPDDSWKSHPQDFKLIALTFDDAPNAADAANSDNSAVKIVNTLNKYCGAGTFFVIGNYFNSKGAGLLQYAVDNGFELGNHSMNHPSWSGCVSNYENISADDFYNTEIAPLNSAIQSAVTDKDGNPYQIKFFRASNLYTSQGIIDACDKYNIPLIGGNQNKSGNFVTINEGKEAFVESAVGDAYDGKILLMHSTDSYTAEHLDEVCEKLYRQGYRFCTLSELFQYKLKVTDMSQVDIANSIKGSSTQKGIFDVNQVELKYYNEDQWFLHPEDYKLIAFTFDDGPVYTEKGDNAVTAVIDVFDGYYGAGTFFFTGRSLDNYGFGIPQHALSKGHELANHSYGHTDLANLDKNATIDEIKKVNDLYAENMNYTCKWFRGAGYSQNAEMWAYNTKIGMPTIASVMGFSDYSGGGSTAESITNWFKTNTLENGSIIGMHSTKNDKTTANALVEVLPYLYEQGYRFCTLSQLIELQGIDYEDVRTDIYIESITVENGSVVYNK